jgi:hypothetical protein
LHRAGGLRLLRFAGGALFLAASPFSLTSGLVGFALRSIGLAFLVGFPWPPALFGFAVLSSGTSVTSPSFH